MLAGILNGSLGLVIHESTKKPLLVWRIQNAQGKGPYQKLRDLGPDRSRDPNLPTSDRALYRFIMRGERFGSRPSAHKEDVRVFVSDMLQPVPSEDFFPSEWHAMPEESLKQHKFGFPTRRAVIDWFGSKAVSRLEAEGYKLTQVPARRVVLSKSGRQLMYVPWKARYTEPPEDYYGKWMDARGQRMKLKRRGKKVRKSE